MLTPALPPGLDDSLQDYCFEDWELPGKYLLQLCPRSLEALTVWPLGHQEIILEGVEQLRALVSEWRPNWLQLPPTLEMLMGAGPCRSNLPPLCTELRATVREPAEPDRGAAGGTPGIPELGPRSPGGLCGDPCRCPGRGRAAGT